MLEDAFGGGLSLRPSLLLAVLLAGLLLVGAAGGLAWHQYDEARRTAVNNARARVILASAIVDTYFSGELAALESIARSATVQSGDRAAMRAYFKRVQPSVGGPFAGGLGWIDSRGLAQASSGPQSRHAPRPLRSHLLQDRHGDGCAVRERGHRLPPHASAHPRDGGADDATRKGT